MTARLAFRNPNGTHQSHTSMRSLVVIVTMFENPRYVRGLDPTLKSERLANYVRTLRRDLLKVSEAIGVAHPGLISADDVDLLVTYGDEAFVDEVRSDPLLSKIPAVRDGAIAVLPDATPLAAAANPTPLSITFNLDDYLDLLAAPLEG